MDLVARLIADARRANERRLLVLTGAPDRTRDRAREIIREGELDADGVRYVGPADSFPCRRFERAGELLGTSNQAVVLDCHDACRPNAIGRAVGAVDGGGLLVLLVPPLDRWPTRRDAFDESLAAPPFDVEDVTGNFRARLVETLRVHRGIAIVDVDTDTVERDGIIAGPPRRGRPEPTVPDEAVFPAATYRACLTQDQADAVGAFEALRSDGRAVVVEADRGRGKSSAAGLAAASLALEGTDVLVTAVQYRSAGEVFERAEELLRDLGELAGRDEGAHCIETETGRIRFAPPAAAGRLPDDPDCVIVDEAASLPVGLLSDFLAADRVAFVTTIHGYEGAGRGFSVRFRDRLSESDHGVTEVALSEPIRYAPADPIEVWSFRALCLGARPAADQLLDDARFAVTYRKLSAETLLADEQLLREAFGLLILAHYRTEPNDLARLLDAPNVSVRALCHDGHVVSVALLAREGDLSPSRRARMYEGERVRGNMIPDVLTSQLRDERAAETVGWRILRIATHHAVRSQGFGSRLLSAIRREATGNVDWLGVSYGATPELLSFWHANGFSTVHLSTTRNDRSGEHSAVMLDPLTAPANALCQRHTRWFIERLPGVLGDALSDVDPDVIRATLVTVDGQTSPSLSEWEWRVVAGVATGMAILDTAPGPIARLALCHLVGDRDASALDARQERLLVLKALQHRSWSAVAERLGFQPGAACKRALSETIRPLIATYGGETARAELQRFD